MNDNMKLKSKVKDDGVDGGWVQSHSAQATTEAFDLKVINALDQSRQDENFSHLRKPWNQRISKLKSCNSNSSSSFVSSEEDNNQLLSWQDCKEFIPLYRKEHGGIIIYDSEGIIPDQPAPIYDGSDIDSINDAKSIIHHQENQITAFEENIDSWMPTNVL